MAPSLKFCPYRIHSSFSLNAHEANSRQGYLIRAQYSPDLIGFADFHPLPDGEANAEDFLSEALEGRPNQQFKNTLRLAQIDAEARKQRRSLFEGLELPLSHYLIQDILAFDYSLVHELWKLGFRQLKIKLGRASEIEKEALLNLKSVLGKSEFKLRLDFNSNNSPEGWLDWEAWLYENLANEIEYIEDPLPWDEKIWTSSRLPIALDLEWNAAEQSSLFFLNRVIWKPALGLNWRPELSTRCVVTHIMDHPLGQMAALHWAATHGIMAAGGFLNGTLADSLGFYRELKSEGPRIHPPKGFGWGFDERLNALEWQS